MQVQQFGYDPKTSQYLVFPTNPNHISQLRDLIHQLCPDTVISPYLRDTPGGPAVSFGVLAANVGSTLPVLLHRLRPALPFTALMVTLTAYHASCGLHSVCNVELSMAPGLTLRGTTGELRQGLIAQLNSPYLVQPDTEPEEVTEIIRRACAELGIYAQGTEIKIDMRQSKTCKTCPPQP